MTIVSTMGNNNTHPLVPLETNYSDFIVSENVAVLSQEMPVNISTETSTVTSITFGNNVVEIETGVLL